MNSLLERQNTQSLSDEREKTEEQQHNAHIGENYRRLFAGSSTSVPGPQDEKRFATIHEYNILASKITFEQAERERQERIQANIQENLQENMQAAPSEAQDQSTVSAAKIAATSEILNSPYYQEAVRRRSLGMEAEAPVSDMPVSEAIEVPSREEELATETAEKAADEALRAAKESSKAMQKAKAVAVTSAEREYYLNLAKKYLAVFAVAFLVLMTVITINSAILGGMDVELTALQQALDEVMARVADLQNAIAQERSWSSILEFIEQSGMVAAF
jgi:hypothetical protein